MYSFSPLLIRSMPMGKSNRSSQRASYSFQISAARATIAL